MYLDMFAAIAGFLITQKNQTEWTTPA